MKMNARLWVAEGGKDNRVFMCGIEYYSTVQKNAIVFERKTLMLTVQFYSDEVSKLFVRVLQEDTMVSIGFEVEGNVGTGTRSKCRKGYVGGLDEGYSVPDASCGKHEARV